MRRCTPSRAPRRFRARRSRRSRATTWKRIPIIQRWGRRYDADVLRTLMSMDPIAPAELEDVELRRQRAQRLEQQLQTAAERRCALPRPRGTRRRGRRPGPHRDARASRGAKHEDAARGLLPLARVPAAHGDRHRAEGRLARRRVRRARQRAARRADVRRGHRVADGVKRSRGRRSSATKVSAR